MTLTHRFDTALQMAHDLHRAQVRKGNQVPYISHLLAVAGIVLEAGADEDEAIAALLHDAVEDQGGLAAASQIGDEFGDPVKQIVLECSDWTGTGEKSAWRERKERFLAGIATLSPSAMLVVSGDKLHNARSLVSDYRREGEAIWAKFSGGRDGTLWYYRAIADALREADGPAPIVDELLRVVTEIEALSASEKA
tara:strand:- start:309 stop:893 length:585 start_codon:yes stop_codon:yes gene_type:complete